MKTTAVKLLALALILTFCFGCVSCTKAEKSEKISVVCTLFPQYDWLREIIGDSDAIELSLIIQNGTDAHSYQPTAADIMKISNADMIVYVGGDSDLWVKEALERAKNDNIIKFEMAECEGVELHNISSASEGHNHGEEEHSHSGHNHGSLDEHLWLSLHNAEAICRRLGEELVALDENNAEKYEENAERYIEKIKRLDGEYEKAVEAAEEENKFVLFCDRFPFVYLLEDYGVEYSAAFEGCSADVDADFATVLRLIKEADEHSLTSIAVSESANMKLADTVKNSSKSNIEKIIVFNSLQAVNKGQIDKGLTYFSVMEENLRALKESIGVE